MPTPPDSLKASIKLDLDFTAGEVDRLVFGSFLEHMGRAVYGGVYDPDSPHSDGSGVRVDVLEAVKQLGVTAVRYPGGNYVSAADWKDGIGPRQERPRCPDFAWSSIETNQFGTDEYMMWCRSAGIEPMLAVNLGTKSPAEAAELVEYCNLTGGTYWSDRRRHNGHPTPHDVKLWCLGNEMDGDWQAGHVPAAAYAQRAFAAAKLMKGIDPTIRVIACGSSVQSLPTYLEWDREVLEYCWDQIDYISAHMYSMKDQDSASFLAEGIRVDRTLSDLDGCLAYVRGRKRSRKRVHIAFDEWNVWYKARRPEDMRGEWKEAPNLLEEMYNLEDAIVVAQYLSSFVRRADLVKIGCLAQIVNVIAPIMARTEGLFLQPIFWPFCWFSQYAAGMRSLTPVVSSPTHHTQGLGEVPSLDVAAVFDAQQSIATLFLTNRTIGAPLKVSVSLADQLFVEVCSAEQMSGEDLVTCNSFEDPNHVVPQRGEASAIEGRLLVELPGPAFACVRSKIVQR